MWINVDDNIYSVLLFFYNNVNFFPLFCNCNVFKARILHKMNATFVVKLLKKLFIMCILFASIDSKSI